MVSEGASLLILHAPCLSYLFIIIKNAISCTQHVAVGFESRAYVSHSDKG